MAIWKRACTVVTARSTSRAWVASIREEALEEGKAPGNAVEDQRRAVAVLDAGGMDLDAQHEPERVGDEMTLAALDALSGIEADHFVRLGTGLDALAVDDHRRRALVATLQLPYRIHTF